MQKKKTHNLSMSSRDKLFASKEMQEAEKQSQVESHLDCIREK